MENLEFKGTKGKWTYDEKTKSFLDENKNNVPMPDNFCSTIPEAEVFGKDKYWNEAQANAKLIASAPELLDALQLLVSQLENEHLSEYCEPLIDKAKQAIEKSLK